VATGIQSGLYYLWYSYFSALHRVASPNGHMLSALEAGWVTVLMTNPLWVISTRQMTVRTSQPAQGWLSTLLSILREEGLPGLYIGTGAALLLCVNPALQFGSYELYTKLYRRGYHGKPKRGIGPFQIFLLAALAKMTSTAISYPIQVLKTRLQATQKQISLGSPSTQDYPVARCGSLNAVEASPPRVISMIRDIWLEHGLTGFYAGLDTKLAQTALTAAIQFVTRDALNHRSDVLVDLLNHVWHHNVMHVKQGSR